MDKLLPDYHVTGCHNAASAVTMQGAVRSGCVPRKHAVEASSFLEAPSNEFASKPRDISAAKSLGYFASPSDAIVFYDLYEDSCDMLSSFRPPATRFRDS